MKADDNRLSPPQEGPVVPRTYGPFVLDTTGKLLGDVPAATAILDRFLHHAEVIAITGKSYRLKDKASKNPSGKAKNQTEEACEEVGKSDKE